MYYTDLLVWIFRKIVGWRVIHQESNNLLCYMAVFLQRKITKNHILNIFMAHHALGWFKYWRDRFFTMKICGFSAFSIMLSGILRVPVACLHDESDSVFDFLYFVPHVEYLHSSGSRWKFLDKSFENYQVSSFSRLQFPSSISCLSLVLDSIESQFTYPTWLCIVTHTPYSMFPNTHQTPLIRGIEIEQIIPFSIW